MNVATLIDGLGPSAVGLGVFLEGETVLVAAGFAASLGYLDPAIVWAVAAIAAFASDQMYFWLGRLFGPRIAQRWPGIRAGIARMQPMIGRHSAKLAFGVRFMIGLRIAGPIAMGMTPGFPALRYATLNLLASLTWAAAGTGLGFFFGQAIAWLLHDLGRYPLELAPLALVALLAAALLARRLRARERPRDRH